MDRVAELLPDHAPCIGDLVEVRSRRWLVEAVEEPPEQSARVSLACADDDAQGQTLEVYWDFEIDRRILKQEAWSDLGSKGFDPPRHFSAFLHTLRWNCVTATDPNLFQSPFRAGIKIDAYQMEPLRKALRLARVNLFIADDTGLGKTIEAGLIARELLLRKKARTVVVAAPASVLEQWKGEMEERFGLLFVILDRAYLAQVRRERGFGVNPWRTHSRFLVSHNLLIDPAYTDPMREWLGDLSPGSLLILDEAHHAAPSSGGRYGIETKFTRAIRDLGGRFEHRLFLSATPHNGHSNSFATLLELLDPYRFTRGVPVRGKSALEDVMVRRIKEDIREVQGGFPKREVCRVVIDGLPDDAPELVLSRLLDEYRSVRETRFEHVPARTRAAAGLLVVGLQQKLLSSIEAFAISLSRHRKTAREQWERFASGDGQDAAAGSDAFASRPHPCSPRPRTPTTIARSTRTRRTRRKRQPRSRPSMPRPRAHRAGVRKPRRCGAPSRTCSTGWRRWPPPPAAGRTPRPAKLIRWIDDHLCPDRPRWNDRRVLIFTENVIGTKRYLREMLEQAIAGTDLAEERIETIDGQTAGANRKEIQRRFNADPADDPLRILIATDAAREGLNFQAHCTDLFHFDLPWNPGRIEQRNGRIDRKLQPAPEVRCHYFALPQRAEDRVLEVLVRKTQTIKRELGSLSKVIDDDIERRLRKGIRHRDAKRLAREIEAADLDQEKKRVAAEELEAARERQEDLKEQIERCRGCWIDHAAGWTSSRSRSATRCPARWSCWAPNRCRKNGRGWLPGLDVPAAHRPDAGRCELDQYPGYAARAAQEQPEAGRVAARSAHPPGRLRGRRRTYRRDGAPAPGAAHGAAPAGPIPRPGLRPSRPVARLPGTGRRLDPARDPAGPAVPVRPPRRTPARDPDSGRRPLDRAVTPHRDRSGRTPGKPKREPSNAWSPRCRTPTPRVRRFIAVCSKPPPRTSRTCCRSSKSEPSWSPEARLTRCAIVARVRRDSSAPPWTDSASASKRSSASTRLPKSSSPLSSATKRNASGRPTSPRGAGA